MRVVLYVLSDPSVITCIGKSCWLTLKWEHVDLSSVGQVIAKLPPKQGALSLTGSESA